MKILIDNSNLYAGGGVQVATSFLYDLAILKEQNEYVIIQSVNSAKQIDRNKFDNRFVFFDLDTTSILGRRKAVRSIENNVKPDVIFTVFGPSYHTSNFPKVVGFAIPHILYPKSPFFDNLGAVDKIKVLALNYLKNIAFKKYSDVLVFESDDATTIYSKKINNSKPTYTVNNSLNEIFSNQEKWEDIHITKSNFDILYLTANYAHKNLKIIPSIIDTLLKNQQVGDFVFHLSVTKEEMKFGDKYDQYINYMGKVNMNQVPLLYKKMDLLIMPTLLEVFSTSYLEAMASNIPIVASDMSFAHDVCGEAALYASPLNPLDYAAKIEQLYTDKSLYNHLVEEGQLNFKRFGSSMDRTVKYLEILKKHAIRNASN